MGIESERGMKPGNHSSKFKGNRVWKCENLRSIEMKGPKTLQIEHTIRTHKEKKQVDPYMKNDKHKEEDTDLDKGVKGKESF